MHCHLVVLVRLSVPVQVIDWKDSEMTYNVLMGTLNPTHSLTVTTAVTVQMQILCKLSCIQYMNVMSLVSAVTDQTARRDFIKPLECNAGNVG